MIEKEADLMHLHKLASLGKLISGMCHELNSPLTAVLAYSEMLKRSVTEERAINQVCKIHEAALRMVKVVDSTLKLSKNRKPTYALLDIDQVILSTVPLFDYQKINDRICIELDLNAAFVPILGDFYQLQQVIFNLLMNSFQALSGKEGGNRKIHISTFLCQGNAVGVMVADTGGGVKKADLERIFQSFFTTRESGLGLGLNIVKSIVEAHSGEIYVESEEGNGCCFRLILPSQVKSNKEENSVNSNSINAVN